MYLCYIDESGVSSIPGNTSHFVLCGIAIPIWHWKTCDRDIAKIKAKYCLDGEELHTAWLMRGYHEQSKIPDFEKMSYQARRVAVNSWRKGDIYRLQSAGNSKKFKQVKKNYLKTDAYIHLTYEERVKFVNEIADCVQNWGFARLFAECVDKVHFDPNLSKLTLDEQAFDQIVSRFEHYLKNTNPEDAHHYGLLIHDNNQTVAKKHTDLMNSFHAKGTEWTSLDHIIETPLFVDSSLTSLIQIADLCSYALRRYLENQEEGLFNLIYDRADRRGNVVVGVRHYSDHGCSCHICNNHTK